MPSYTYQCESCGQAQIQMHGMSESPRFACPDCGGLTHKVPGKPVILSTNTATPEEAQQPSSAHQHGPGCALHRHDLGGGCGHAH